MAADVVDDTGQPVRGAVGELAIRGPWPGMTRGFWGDDRAATWRAYWSRIPGLWVHGDWAQIDDDGFWYILGRSDDTIKVAGKRVGPAEVESAAVAHPAVREAAAIGVPDALKGEAVVVFVILRPGHEPTDEPCAPRSSAAIVDAAGQEPRARSDPLRHRPAQDPQRQDPAPRHQSTLPGPGTGRYLVAGEPAAVDEIANAR